MPHRGFSTFFSMCRPQSTDSHHGLWLSSATIAFCGSSDIMFWVSPDFSFQWVRLNLFSLKCSAQALRSQDFPELSVADLQNGFVYGLDSVSVRRWVLMRLLSLSRWWVHWHPPLRQPSDLRSTVAPMLPCIRATSSLFFQMRRNI
jgi:hypothetical protein